LALDRNPTFRATREQVAAASGRAAQSRAWPNPELELGVEEWPVSGSGGFSDAKQTIGLAQTLPFPGKKSLDRKAATAGVQLTEAELAVRRAELVRDVKAAFFRVLASERLVAVVGELTRLAQTSAETARKRVEAGATAYQEQLRAEVQLDQARAELAVFEDSLAAARRTLAVRVGLPGAEDWTVIGALAEQADAGLIEADPEPILAAHPSVAGARAAVDRARWELGRARKEPYPDLTAAVAGGRLGETDESIIEFRLSFPLPILDTKRGAIAEAQANVTIAEAQLEAVRQELQRALVDATRRYQMAADQVSRYRESILPKTDEALRLVQTGFAEGKFGFMDLLDTQRTLAEARLAYQQSLLELNLAQAELEALTLPASTPSPSQP
jgi:cobalt-zinc-cadmium efflux system outer membrane protein